MATVIFGAAGIGKALASRLIKAGKPVVLVARDAAKLSAVSQEFASGSLLKTRAVDVTAFDALEGVCKEIVTDASSQGGVSGMCFAVGSIPLKPLKSTSANDLISTYSLNTVAPALALKNLAPALAAGEKPGSAVLFSSIAARTGFLNHVAISAAKAAVEGLTVSAAAELCPKVRVNAIAPSLTDTPLAGRLVSTPAAKTALGAGHPLPRLGTADEIAELAFFLLQDSSAGWITGQVFAVDGGRSTLRNK